MQRLNLGCGSDIRAGWINVDRTALPAVDVVHDLNQLPLPFATSSIDQVAARDVFEHVEYVPLLRDIYRVLRDGGTLEIQVPHFTAASNFIDPTHRHRFSIRTFEFFVPNSDFGRDYYFDFTFTAIVVRRIRFMKWPLVYNYLVEPLVNSHRVVQKYYELTMLASLFPATNITVTLVK